MCDNHPMKKLMIHMTIVSLTAFAADFALNEGRASQAIMRDMNSDQIIKVSKRKAGRANAYIRAGAKM